MIEKTYVVIKDLPDVKTGEEVLWDEGLRVYWYKKENGGANCLTKEQVEKNQEYFCKAEEYPEYYAWRHPVYSREEVCNLIKECFPNRKFSGSYYISASEELQRFERRLREMGKQNAEKILENKI